MVSDSDLDGLGGHCLLVYPWSSKLHLDHGCTTFKWWWPVIWSCDQAILRSTDQSWQQKMNSIYVDWSDHDHNVTTAIFLSDSDVVPKIKLLQQWSKWSCWHDGLTCLLTKVCLMIAFIYKSKATKKPKQSSLSMVCWSHAYHWSICQNVIDDHQIQTDEKSIEHQWSLCW